MGTCRVPYGRLRMQCRCVCTYVRDCVYTYSNLEQMCGQARTIAGVA